MLILKNEKTEDFNPKSNYFVLIKTSFANLKKNPKMSALTRATTKKYGFIRMIVTIKVIVLQTTSTDSVITFDRSESNTPFLKKRKKLPKNFKHINFVY
jgi:hypothetical protein